MKYLAITAILCFILAGVSFAGEVTMTEVITGGNLTLTMPDNFSLSGTTIGGGNQSATANSTYYIEDSRGTGVGWNLSLQGSDFVTSGTPIRTIPNASYAMRIQQSNITAVWGQSVDPSNGPRSITTNWDHAYGTKNITSALGYGMGKYNILIEQQLTVVPQRYAGTYTSTLTATLNNAP